MMKLLRNLLGDKKILINNNNGAIINWKYIKNLHNLQDKEGLRAAYKIGRSHLEYHKQKMKVKLAVQVFSSSVAKGIILAQELGIEGFENCEGTVDFIQMIDQYVLTYKTSQDHLELFFSCLRSRGGFNNNPSAYQLRSAVRAVLIGKMDALTTGNCIPIDNTNLICGDYQKNDNDDDHIYPIDISFIDVPNIPKLSLYLYYVATYISGYIIRKLISEKKVKCYNCISAMIDKTCEDNENHNLIKIKNNQGLIIPSKSVSKLCQLAESAFRIFEKNNQIKKSFIFKCIVSFVISKAMETNIFDDLVDHMLNQEATFSHYQILITLIVERYINIRLYHYADKHKKNSNINIRQKLTKTILFAGQ
ncbi:uncharacterized protein LOC135922021 [Gordionus sp. m RMFG-2023]|uniref:uncharacterized protein LOC135922021 n=1 Tax=Gordionus sp. m RMFG-2023 TaxID=3053472 RepID=UPI0031FDA372